MGYKPLDQIARCKNNEEKDSSKQCTRWRLCSARFWPTKRRWWPTRSNLSETKNTCSPGKSWFHDQPQVRMCRTQPELQLLNKKSWKNQPERNCSGGRAQIWDFQAISSQAGFLFPISGACSLSGWKRKWYKKYGIKKWHSLFFADERLRGRAVWCAFQATVQAGKTGRQYEIFSEVALYMLLFRSYPALNGGFWKQKCLQHFYADQGVT